MVRDLRTQLPVFDKDLLEVADGSRDRDQLCREPDFSLDLSPIEPIETLIRLVKALVRLIEPTRKLAPRRFQLVANLPKNLHHDVCHAKNRTTAV